MANTVLKRRNESGALEFTALSTTGVDFTCHDRDDRTVILIHNTAASGTNTTVTVCKGDTEFAKKNDLTLTVANGAYHALTLDGAFYHQQGHKIKLKGATDIKATIVELP